MSAITETHKSLLVLISNLREEQTRVSNQLSAAQRALKALDGDGVAPKRRTTTQTESQPKGVVPAGKLLRLLDKQDGIGTGALASEANAERVQVLTLLKELEADGRVRRTGQRRGTRWFAAAKQ